MSIDQKIIDRLQQLIEDGEKVLRTKSTKTEEGTSYLGEYAVDYAMGNQWGTSCLNILGRVFSRDSDHYTRFKELASDFEIHSNVKKAWAVMKAAKDDYEHG